MDYEQLKHLIREHYPFPIAHAHKKTMGVLDDDLEKLKCLLETAEITIQFLALLTLAQVRQDLLNVPQASRLQSPFEGDRGVSSPCRDGPGVGLPSFAPFSQGNLKDIIDLKNPSFGKWYGLTRDIIKHYREVKDRLVVPELFDFWFRETSGKKLRLCPLHQKIIEPLMALRNDFHHGRVPENQVGSRVAEGLTWLQQLLEAVQFLAQYELSFVQRILLNQDARRQTYYVHDLTLFNGCLYERDRRQFDMHLEPSSLIFLHSKAGQHLLLNPFIVFTDHLKGPDIFLLNNVAKKKMSYVSSQFAGEELQTNDEAWKDGRLHHEAMSEFFDILQNVPQTPAPGSADILSVPTPGPSQEGITDETPVLPSEEAGKMPALPGEEAGEMPAFQGEEPSPLSTTEVFQQRYQVSERIVEHISPYKFLDYYNPEDYDIFFGRDKEIRLLERKFHNTRLLVLHGESGTGKTSLIRAGLIPRLPPEVYASVYIRILKEPLREIKRELLQQLGLDESLDLGGFSKAPRSSPLELPLAELLGQVTARVSKTIVIVLDQFEEFFLRFPEEVRQQFEKEFAACVETPRLDVKFLISLRADYFSYLATFESSIPNIFTHQVQLERLSETQALEAVVKPAERLGIQVDEAMVQIKLLPELLSEEGGIEPPLLQIVCDAMYQNAQSERRQEIDMRDYEAIGDVKGALGNYLDDKLRQFGKDQRTAKAVLKALVTAEGTKRASLVEELVSRIQSTGLQITVEGLKIDYLDKFVRDRLVRVEEVEGKARYELSHEYLVKHIKAWIEESEREITKVLELIDRAYEAYQATGLLLETRALQVLKPFKDQLILPAKKQAFVDRSKKQVRKKRRRLLLKVAMLLVFVALVVGGLFVGFFGYQIYLTNQILKDQVKIAVNKQKEAGERSRRAEEQSALLTELFKKNLQKTDINPVEFFSQTSKALFLSKNDDLGALLAGLRASKRAKHTNVSPILRTQVVLNLREVLAGIHEKNRLVGHKGAVESIAFSPDGTLLASGGEDRTINLWNVADGSKIHTLQGHSRDVGSVAFSPDGILLASGSWDNTIKLWNVADGREIAALHGHSDGVESVSFSPDGTMLASGSHREIKLWKVADGKEITTLYARYSGRIGSVAFNPDGTLLASGGQDDVIKLWNVADGSEVKTLRGHSGDIMSVMFSPDGTLLASGSQDRFIKLWNVEDGTEIRTLRGHAGPVSSVSFSSDGTLLASGSNDNTVKLWNAADGKEIKTLYGHSENVNSVTFSPAAALLASGSGKHRGPGEEYGGPAEIKLWDITDNREIILHEHSYEVQSVTFSPNGTLLASGSGGINTPGEIRLWDVIEGREFTTFPEYPDKVASVAFSPDGTLLASGSYDKTIKLWNVADGSEISTLSGHSAPVFCVSFSPDGTILASGSNEEIKLWNVTDGLELKTLHGHTNTINSVVFSPDGRLLASGSNDSTIRLWNVDNGRAITKLYSRSPIVTSVMFSPDATLLASGGGYENSMITLWNIAEGREIMLLQGHSNIINSIAFSPDGDVLASGSEDKSIKIWNVADGSEITTLHGHSDTVTSVVFSSDGALLASGSEDKTIKLWNLDLDNWLVHGCEWLHGYLKNNPNVSEADRSLCEDIYLLESGHYSLKQGRLTEAMAAFQKLLEIEPEHEEAWYNIGVILQAQGKPDEAITAFQKQVEINPGHEDAWYNTGVILQAQGKLDEASAIFQKYAKVMQKQGKLNQAVAAFQKLLEMKLNHDNAWYSIGLVLQKQGKLDEAFTAFQKQVENKPDHEDAWYRLGTILQAQRKLDEAIAAFQKQVECKPDHGNAWYNLGNIFYKQDNLDNAITAYQKQLEVKPDHEGTSKKIWDIGNELERQGKLDEAIDVYEKLFEVKFSHPDAWNEIGMAFYRQDKLDEAITAFRNQVEINPDNKSAWGNLAAILYKEGNVDEAAKVAAEGLTVFPNHRFLLYADALFALAQNDSTRCQTRVTAALSQVTPKDKLFVILPFLDWLANPEQGWKPVMTAINELDPEVTFTGGKGSYYSDLAPAIERLDAQTREIAQHFIAFFEGEIDLKTLKARLAEQEETER